MGRPSKKFAVKKYTGKLTRTSKKPAYTKFEANRTEALDILNDRENVPDEFKGIPAQFTYFDFAPKKEGGFKEVLVRVDTGVEVTDEIRSFVRDIFDPSWTTDVEEALEIRTYRPWGLKGKTREALLETMNAIVDESDSDKRKSLLAQAKDQLQTVLG